MFLTNIFTNLHQMGLRACIGYNLSFIFTLFINPPSSSIYHLLRINSQNSPSIFTHGSSTHQTF